VDCSAVACVALTFDDGPGPFTARLLDELGSAGARATFFVLGMNAQSHPDLVQRMLAGGMTVASHTWDHRDMRRLSDADARAEVDRTSSLLASLGVPATGLLRPPFGAFCPATRTLGHALVLWDVDTEDWRNRDIGTTTARALATARPGSMILLHDVQASTVAAVPGIVEQLRARGLTLVTVPELLGPTQPGGVYFRRA
jgi:peptidoglycan/xylan/chitin deacetylase (PgdA/CDA1 family)